MSSARVKADFTIRNGGATLNALRRALRAVDFLADQLCGDGKPSAADRTLLGRPNRFGLF